MDPFIKIPDSCCHICADKVSYWAVGSCNHPVCFICSLRLRCLYGSKLCPMCKTELDSVIVGDKEESLFQDLVPLVSQMKKGIDLDEGMIFQNGDIQNHCKYLLQQNCPIRRCKHVSKTKDDLKRHVRKDHQLLVCEVCFSHKKIFTLELSLFTKEDLSIHTSKGDDTFPGHPNCGFCQINFYSKDELFTHCREKHEECFICRQNGVKDEFYRDYSEMEKHFEEAHFLCKEKECLDQKFVVFRTDIDLKAHMAEVHLGSSKLSRSQVKAMKRIDLALGGRSSGGSGSSHLLNLSIGRDSGGQARLSRSSSGTEISTRKGRMSRTASSEAMNNQGRDRGSISSSDSIASSSVAASSSSRRESLNTTNIDSVVNGTRSLSMEESNLKKASRDAELVRILKDALGGNERKFEEFRQLSIKFRNFDIDCPSYIQSFVAIFGLEKANRVFPSLLDSFPDKDRRSQLLEHFQRQEQMQRDFPTLPPKSNTSSTSLLDKTKGGARVLVIKKAVEDEFPHNFKVKKGKGKKKKEQMREFKSVVEGSVATAADISQKINNAYKFELPPKYANNSTNNTGNFPLTESSSSSSISVRGDEPLASTSASSTVVPSGAARPPAMVGGNSNMSESFMFGAASKSGQLIEKTTSSNASSTTSLPFQQQSSTVAASSHINSPIVAPIWAAKMPSGSLMRSGKSGSADDFPSLPVSQRPLNGLSDSFHTSNFSDFDIIDDSSTTTSSNRKGKKKILYRFG